MVNRTLAQFQTLLSRSYLLVPSVHAMLLQGVLYNSATTLGLWQLHFWPRRLLLISSIHSEASVERWAIGLLEMLQNPVSSVYTLKSHVQNFA